MDAVMKQTWKYLLVDVDGTLLDSQGRISDRARRVLARAVEAGVTLVLASGRTYHSLQRVSADLDLPFHMISNGGAVGLEPGLTRVSYTRFMAPELWPDVVRRLRAAGLSTAVYSHDHPAPSRFYIESERGDPHFEAYLERHRERALFVPDLAEARIPQVVEVAALGAGETFDAASSQVMAGMNGRATSHSMVLFINANFGKITEFFSAGTSKWRAFLGMFPEAADHLDSVVAIGDEANDMEMIRAAGMGIAMGNATAACKAVADRVTLENDRDGLAAALEEFWG